MLKECVCVFVSVCECSVSMFYFFFFAYLSYLGLVFATLVWNLITDLSDSPKQ